MTDDDTLGQQIQLDILRRRLAYHVGQQRRLGGETPFAIVDDIRSARADIAHIKATLRAWGIAVDDLPDDLDVTASSTAVHPAVDDSSFSMDIVHRWTLATVVGSVIGYGFGRGWGLELTDRLVQFDLDRDRAYGIGFGFMGMLVGLLCGVLQQRLAFGARQGRGWMLACTLAFTCGWGVGGTVSEPVKVLVSGWMGAAGTRWWIMGRWMGDAISWSITGIVIGLWQWLLRPHVIVRPHVWLCATMLAWGSGGLAADLVTIEHIPKALVFAQSIIGIISGSIIGLVVGILTGLTRTQMDRSLAIRDVLGRRK